MNDGDHTTGTRKQIYSSDVIQGADARGQGDDMTHQSGVMGNSKKVSLTSADTRSQSLSDCHLEKHNEISNGSNDNNGIENDNNTVWYNTWPEKQHPNTESYSVCDKITQVRPVAPQLDSIKCKPFTLNEALNTFQLAYNPITKQLQLSDKVASDENRVDVESSIDSPSSDEKVRKGHHRTIGASSISSTISSISDPSASSSGSLLENEDYTCEYSSNPKTEKKSFTTFFSRKAFISPGSWKLFGIGKSSSSDSLNISENLMASSSALIQHIRPSTLPAKDSEEERRHRDEYEAILQAARKRDIENTKARRLKQERQFKQEEQLSAAAKIWSNNILSSWETLRCQKKTRDLWWQGLPPSVRGKVWILAIGNDLNVTSSLYNICLTRAHERLKLSNLYSSSHPSGDDQESSLDVIQLDISRTFPNLGIFQEGGPYYDILHELLASYVCYRPDVGYVQGMSFLAAILILNMEPVDAFICFANLVNRPLLLAAFTFNHDQLNVYFAAYSELFKDNLPKLYEYFAKVSLSPDLYLLDWIYTVFAKAMPLDVACRVWDVYLRDGDEFIFRTALGVLNHYQETLFTMDDFLHGAQFLTRLPDDMPSNEFFQNIKTIVVSSKKRTFVQLLDKCKEKITSIDVYS